MDELIAKLDAEVASLLVVLAPIREQLSKAEENLARLQTAKATLLGQRGPVQGKTLAMGRKPGSGQIRPRGELAGRIAAVIKANGSLRFTEICKQLDMNSGQASVTLRTNPDLFTQVDGPRSAWTLTEAGKARAA